MVITKAGRLDSEVVVILEPGNSLFKTKKASVLLQECFIECGVNLDNVAIIRCSPQFPKEIEDNKSAVKEFILSHRNNFMTTLAAYKPKAIVVCGSNALVALLGNRSVKISDYAGKVKQVGDYKVITTSSLDLAASRLDPISIFKAEFRALKKFKEANYIYSDTLFNQSSSNYEWRVDISDILKNKPSSIAFDTETTGLDWKLDSVYPIVAQMTFREGHSILTPLSKNYFPDYFREKFGEWDLDILISQWKELLEDPNVKVIGHNIKFDMHMISKVGIEINNVFIDTMQLLHAIDENSQKRNLDIAVKQYVHDLFGYADVFNEDTDKGNMIEVHPDKMIAYAGGDTDATFRLAKALYKVAQKDKSNLDVFLKIRMPAIKSFYRLEKTGIRVDMDHLPVLAEDVQKDLKERRVEMMKHIPKKLLRKHAWLSGEGDKLRPTNAELMIDALFSRDGYNLTPKVFTGQTKHLKNPKDKIPTLSVKDHLVYFKDEGVELIELYEEEQKLSKLASTYIGDDNDEEKLKGLYKYIHFNPDNKETRVHTSFNLNTTTGRSSSQNPNVQNLPQGRGDKNSRASQVAKSYKRLFIPRDGYTMVEIDYSQAEVRLAACVSKDPELLRIYRNGEDVYRATAANVMMGLTMDEFLKLPENIRKSKRQSAKAVVLGYLYGMMDKKFAIYAKTTFGVEFTPEEARQVRDNFFRVHHGLAKWHEDVKRTVARDKQIKSLLGATRHLPGVDSYDEWIVRENERNAINSPIQGDASNFGLIALDYIYKDFDLNIVRPVNFVHDALYFEVKTEYVKEYCSYLKWYMENIPIEQMFGVKLDVPFIAEVEIGSNFADKEELKIESRRPVFASI